MIGHRYAVGTRPAPRQVATSATRHNRLPSRAAQSSRDYLLDTLGASVPIQLMLAMSLVALAAMVFLYQAGQASVLQINIPNLQAEQTSLQLQNTQLLSAASGWQSYQRIDSQATHRLHMTKPDLSKAIWIRPVVPAVPPPTSASTDTLSAQQQSQPIAWVHHALDVIGASL